MISTREEGWVCENLPVGQSPLMTHLWPDTVDDIFSAGLPVTRYIIFQRRLLSQFAPKPRTPPLKTIPTIKNCKFIISYNIRNIYQNLKHQNSKPMHMQSILIFQKQIYNIEIKRSFVSEFLMFLDCLWQSFEFCRNFFTVSIVVSLLKIIIIYPTLRCKGVAY